ncbi:hypothetical protein JCM30566_11150 [Marinitoga arctica]
MKSYKFWILTFFSTILIFISCDRINFLPSIPVNIYPIDESINIEINPILKWNSDDQDGDTLYYTLYFGKNRNSLNKIISNFTDTKYQMKNLDYSTTYYWKIEVSDKKNTGSVSSPIWSFTTTDANSKPNNPPIIKINGLENNSIIPFNFTFSWVITDPENDELKYTNVYLNDDLISESSESTYVLYNLERDKEYILKIISEDVNNHQSKKEIKFKTVDKAMVSMHFENNKLILSGRDIKNIIGISLSLEYDNNINIEKMNLIDDAENPDFLYGPAVDSKNIIIDIGFFENRNINGNFLELDLKNYEPNTKIFFKNVTILISPTKELDTDFSSWIILK